ncbi:MAG: hypothetical protein NTV49_12110 [Kiritimatiellaeota bacterium]|nr:hypothetical protein [Kiritimatiellota bacterium]
MNEITESSDKAFWPIALVALSLILVLGRDLYVSSKQKVMLKQIGIQQDQGVLQSRQVAANFEKMMRDLLQLAQTDTDAKAIVTKYGIKITEPPAAPAPARSK